MTRRAPVRIAIRWGIVLGVALCVWTTALHLLGFYTTRIGAGQVADLVAMVLPLAAIAGALRERRLTEGRGLRFRESVTTGVVGGIVSAPIAASFLWWYHHYMNPQWLDLLIAWKTATMTAVGASSADITSTIDGLRTSGTDRAQLIGAFVGSIVVSLVISAVMHLYFRRASRSRTTSSDPRR